MKKMCKECRKWDTKNIPPSCEWENGILPERIIKKELERQKKSETYVDEHDGVTYHVESTHSSLIRCNKCNCSELDSDSPKEEWWGSPPPGVTYHHTCRNCGNVQDYGQPVCHWCGSWKLKSFNALNYKCTVCDHHQRRV